MKMTIAESLRLLLRNPGQFLATWVRHAPLFLQSQMDINPRSRWHNREFIKQTRGFYPESDATTHREICDLEPWDNVRRDMLILLLRTVIESDVAGDFAEVGVYKGQTARLIHHYAPDRRLHLFDTFRGFTGRGAASEVRNTGESVQPSGFSDTSVEAVIAQVSPRNDRVSCYPGYFPDSIPEAIAEHRFAFVHLDADLYEPIAEGLAFFYERMSVNGMIVVHDYNAWPGARQAVDSFLLDKPELALPMPDKSGSVVIVKQAVE